METANVEAGLKPYLTLDEFAAFIGKPYGTVWTWVNEGRIPTETRGTKKKFHRVAAETALKAKKRLEDGLWI